jgi:hypothetical protein
MGIREGKTLEDLKEHKYRKIGEDIRIMFKAENRIRVYVEKNKVEYEPLLGFKKRKYWEN